MMIAALFWIIFEIVSYVQAGPLPSYGDCSYQNFTLRARPCHTLYIQDSRTNPGGNFECNLRKEREAFFDCNLKTLDVCYPALSGLELRLKLRGIWSKEMLCDKAGLQFPKKLGVNNTLPCSIPEDEYDQKIYDCTRDFFRDLWKPNRADPMLCGGYTWVKNCVRNVIQTKCTTTGHPWFEELMSLQLGKYNPFCDGLVDGATPVPPNTTAPPPAPIATTAASQSLNSPLQGVMVFFIFVCSFMFLWFY